MKNFIPKIGDICIVNLPDDGIYSLRGNHPCLVYQKEVHVYKVVPITSNKKKLYWCEYPIEKGRGNIDKDSKFKFDQIARVSREKILYKIGIADKGMLNALSKYLKIEANSIDRLAA